MWLICIFCAHLFFLNIREIAYIKTASPYWNMIYHESRINSTSNVPMHAVQWYLIMCAPNSSKASKSFHNRIKSYAMWYLLFAVEESWMPCISGISSLNLRSILFAWAHTLTSYSLELSSLRPSNWQIKWPTASLITLTVFPCSLLTHLYDIIFVCAELLRLHIKR